ncbi:MAG: MFS transporter [Thermodesulfobacteriota bacterium]
MDRAQRTVEGGLAGFDRQVWTWALCDWANSAFATTVLAGFFPILFKEYWHSAGVESAISTARLGLGNSLASLLVAVLAPLAGVLADQGLGRKKGLLAGTLLGAGATALLMGVPAGGWLFALIVYGAAVVGFSLNTVFTDALLPLVAPRHRLPVASGLGFAAGYLGGGLFFLLAVLATLRPGLVGLHDPSQAALASFGAVALWWLLFTGPALAVIREPRPAAGIMPVFVRLRAAGRQLGSAVAGLRHRRQVALFLAAYWFYIDGVDTIIRMAVDYGLSLGFSSSDLIVALLLVQFVGFPATLAFGRLGSRIGPRPAVLWGLAAYAGVTLWGALMASRWEFFGLAAVIGLVQGGVQSQSRALFARLIPPEEAGQLFGLYNTLGRFAAILGPALMGLVGLVVRRLVLPVAAEPAAVAAANRLAARAGILAVLLLFAAGAALLARVREVDPDQGAPSGGRG